MSRKHKQHQDWTDIDEGWLYGEWETGPWWGFHTKEKAYATYGWVSIGSDETIFAVRLLSQILCLFPTMLGKKGASVFTTPFTMCINSES